MLLLVPGKIYQVPQQKRLHHGEGLLVLGTQGVVNSGGVLARVGCLWEAVETRASQFHGKTKLFSVF